MAKRSYIKWYMVDVESLNRKTLWSEIVGNEY